MARETAIHTTGYVRRATPHTLFTVMQLRWECPNH